MNLNPLSGLSRSFPPRPVEGSPRPTTEEVQEPPADGFVSCGWKALGCALVLAGQIGTVCAEGMPVKLDHQLHPKKAPTPELFHQGKPYLAEGPIKGTADFEDWLIHDPQGRLVGYATTRGKEKLEAPDIQFYPQR